MNEISNHTDLNIFFDESGKLKSDKVQLMGGLVLPTNIYFNEQFSKLRKLNTSYRLHWSEYKGDSKQRNGIVKLLTKANPLTEYIQLNFIRYSSSELSYSAVKYDEAKKKHEKSIMHKMVYSKLPERIIYGLLRRYGGTQSVTALINIEYANEYIAINLGENMKEQLNVHSLYRGEAFVVRDYKYRKKGEEIGVELTDILLGIVRTILENNNLESRKKRAQNLLILSLLRKNLLQPYIDKIRLFELKGTDELLEVDLQSCLNLFISKNYDKYIKVET